MKHSFTKLSIRKNEELGGYDFYIGDYLYRGYDTLAKAKQEQKRTLELFSFLDSKQCLCHKTESEDKNNV